MQIKNGGHVVSRHLPASQERSARFVRDTLLCSAKVERNAGGILQIVLIPGSGR